MNILQTMVSHSHTLQELIDTSKSPVASPFGAVEEYRLLTDIFLDLHEKYGRGHSKAWLEGIQKGLK